MRMHNAGTAILTIAAITTTANAGLLGIDRETGAAYDVSTVNGLATTIGTFSLGGSPLTSIGSLEFAPNGTLYGFTTGSTATLYSFHPTTFAATPVGSLNNGFVFEGGLAFSPSGVAYGVNHLALMMRDVFDEDFTVLGQGTDGVRFVLPHQTRVAHHISGEDHCESAVLL